MPEEIKKEESAKSKVEAVATGKKTKKSFLRNVKDSFIAEEAKDLGQYLLKDVLVPYIQDAIIDGFEGGLSLVFGRDVSKRRKGSNSGYSRVNYRASYDYSRSRERERDREYKRSSPRGFDELIFETKEDALEVLDHLDNCLEEYGQVSIGDMYDLADQPNSPEDYNYGWTNLSYATVERLGPDEYLLKMPKAKCIK